MQTTDSAKQRDQLVNEELRSEGIRDEAVLRAMCSVPREEFLPEKFRELAYRDVALPIEAGQSISQPYIVALMVEALELKPDQKVLEIGTGSGYAAAVLSRVAKQIVSIERVEELARIADERLKRLGYDNVRVVQGDGTLGCSEFAPFDAIVVAAGGPSVPQALLDQLRIGGRLVIPVGEGRGSQLLIRVRRNAENIFLREDLGRVRFVPLIGEAGWHEEPDDED